jgi:hypothetical protein
MANHVPAFPFSFGCGTPSRARNLIRRNAVRAKRPMPTPMFNMFALTYTAIVTALISIVAPNTSAKRYVIQYTILVKSFLKKRRAALTADISSKSIPEPIRRRVTAVAVSRNESIATTRDQLRLSQTIPCSARDRLRTRWRHTAPLLVFTNGLTFPLTGRLNQKPAALAAKIKMPVQTQTIVCSLRRFSGHHDGTVFVQKLMRNTGTPAQLL